jgi:hypothetical protein
MLILKLWLPGMRRLVIADLSEDLAAYECRIEDVTRLIMETEPSPEMMVRI